MLYNLGVTTGLFEQQRSDECEVISSNVIRVSDQLTDYFLEQKNVMSFLRRRFTDGSPGSLATNYTRLDVASHIELDLPRHLPMTQIIHEHTGFKIGRIEEELVAEAADPITAKCLSIDPLSPVIRLWGRTFDQDGQVLNLADIVYRGDSFAFVQRVSFTQATA